MSTIRILNLTRIYPNSVYNSEGRSVRSLDHALVNAGHQVTTLVLRQWVPSWIASHFRSYKHLMLPDSDTQDHGLRVIVSRYLHIPKLPYQFRAYANVQMFKWRVMQIYHDLGKEYDSILAQGAWIGITVSQMTQELGVPHAIILRDDFRHLLSDDIKPIRPLFD
jgi:hypothetical protein